MEISFTITRTAVMAKVEGLTVTLAQHNPGVPFETLWASAGDQGKLDLYYKEAIGDFEDTLKRWIKTSSSQFDILAKGTDYAVTLEVPANWAQKLNGLLANKIQDYFAHALLANWLADLPEGTPIHPDYTAITTADLSSIQDILLERGLKYNLGVRSDASDTERSDDDSFVLSAVARTTDDDDTVHPFNDWTNWSDWEERPFPHSNGNN